MKSLKEQSDAEMVNMWSNTEPEFIDKKKQHKSGLVGLKCGREDMI